MEKTYDAFPAQVVENALVVLRRQQLRADIVLPPCRRSSTHSWRSLCNYAPTRTRKKVHKQSRGHPWPSADPLAPVRLVPGVRKPVKKRVPPEEFSAMCRRD